MTYNFKKPHALGFTLLEMIIHIVIISIAISGTMLFFQTITAKSSENLERRKVLEAASLLMDEIQQMGFNYCTILDTNVTTASSPAACFGNSGGGIQSFAAPPATGAFAKSRLSSTTPFDNVGDYHSYFQSPPTDITNNSLPDMTGYSFSVAISSPLTSLGPVGSGGVGIAIPPSEIAQIIITVSNPSGKSWNLSGYRFRHSPNSLP